MTMFAPRRIDTGLPHPLTQEEGITTPSLVYFTVFIGSASSVPAGSTPRPWCCGYFVISRRSCEPPVRCSSLHNRTARLRRSLLDHFPSTSPAVYVAPFVQDHGMWTVPSSRGCILKIFLASDLVEENGATWMSRACAPDRGESRGSGRSGGSSRPRRGCCGCYGPAPKCRSRRACSISRTASVSLDTYCELQTGTSWSFPRSIGLLFTSVTAMDTPVFSWTSCCRRGIILFRRV